MTREICIISREYDGLAGAGGLKDVVRALVKQLAAADCSVTVIIPRYKFLRTGSIVATVPLDCTDPDFNASVMEIDTGNVKILAVDHPVFSSKSDIYNYNTEDSPEPSMLGKGHMDVHKMNFLFQEAAVRYLISTGNAPEVIHAHDAHTAMMGCYMNYLGSDFFRETGLVTTIHNAGIAYQQIPGNLVETSRLSGLPESILVSGLIDEDVVPFLLAGRYGLLNTVSPGYASELLSDRDRYSGKLGPVLKQQRIRLRGITNGLDADVWSDGSTRRDSRERILQGLRNQKYPGTQSFGNFPDLETHWILFHGRLAYQKGLDEILTLASGKLNNTVDGHIIVYGQGDPELESKAEQISGNMDNWLFIKGYNPELTLHILKASSWVLVPSRWEPCGQIDMIGQLLGALPIVRRVGGLKKVRNRLDGLSYKGLEIGGLEKKLLLALKWERKRQGKVRRMRRRAENTIYERRSWRKVLIRGYLPLYRKARKWAKHHSAGYTFD